MDCEDLNSGSNVKVCKFGSLLFSVPPKSWKSNVFCYLLSRDLEVYGVMSMLWNSLTLVHLQLLQKSNCTMSL